VSVRTVTEKAVSDISDIFVYGAACTWFGSIHDAAFSFEGLACCPYCGSVLTKMMNEPEWWNRIAERDKTEPGSMDIFRWAKQQSRCFPNMEELHTAFKNR
jgi:hypothetical protein